MSDSTARMSPDGTPHRPYLLFDGLHLGLLLLVTFCFFMPFFSISCGGIRANFSGLNLALGTEPTIDAPSPRDERAALREFSKDSRKLPMDLPLLIIPCAGLIGAALAWLVFTGRQPRGLAIAPATLLLVFGIYCVAGLGIERALSAEARSGDGPNIEAALGQRETWFYIGLWGSGLALLLALARRWSPALAFEAKVPSEPVTGGSGQIPSPPSSSPLRVNAVTETPPGGVTLQAHPAPAPSLTAALGPIGTVIGPKALLGGATAVVVAGFVLWLALAEWGLPDAYGYYAIDGGRTQNMREAGRGLALSPGVQFLVYDPDELPRSPLVKLDLEWGELASLMGTGWSEKTPEQVLEVLSDWNQWNAPPIACQLKPVRKHPDMTRVVPSAPLRSGIYLLKGSGYFFTVDLPVFQQAMMTEARSALGRRDFETAMVSAAKAFGSRYGPDAAQMFRQVVGSWHAASAHAALSKHDWEKVAEEAQRAFVWAGQPEMKKLQADVPFLRLEHEARSAAGDENWVKACSAAQGALGLRPEDPGMRALLEQSPRIALDTQDRGPIRSVWFASDASTLFTASRDAITVWDVQSRKLLKRLDNPCRDARWASTPDGRKLAWAENGLRVCDLDKQLVNTVLKDTSSTIRAFELSPEGKLLYAAGRWYRESLPRGDFQALAARNQSYVNGVATLDVSAQRIVRFSALPDGDPPEYMTSSETGNTIAIVYRDGHILQFDPDLHSTAPLLSGEGANWYFRLASDEMLVGLRFGGTSIQRFDLAQGQRPLTNFNTTSPIRAASWTPELLGLATDDGLVHIYALGTGQKLETVRERANDVAVSPDGRWLACGEDEGRVALWKLKASVPQSRPTDTPLPDVRKSTEALLAAGKLEEACAAATKALRARPSDPELTAFAEQTRKTVGERATAAARAAVAARDWPAAARQARLALRYEASSEVSALLENLPYMQAADRAEAAAEREDWDELRAAAEQAASLKPGDKRARDLLDRIPRESFVLEGAGEVRMLHFGIDTGTLLFGTNSSIVTWDVGAKRVATNYRNEFRSTRLAIAPNCRTVAGLNSEGLAVANYSNEKIITYTSSQWARPTGWGFVRDGRYLWIAGNFHPQHLVARGASAAAVGPASKPVAGMVKIDLLDSNNVTQVSRFQPSLRATPPIHLGRSFEGGRMLQLYEDGYAAVFDADTGAVLAQHAPALARAIPVFRSEDSILLVTLGGTIACWDFQANSPERNLLTTPSPIRAFSCRAGRLAIATEDHMVTVYDSASGEKLQSFRESEALFNIELSRDGRLLACGGPEGKLILWKLKEIPAGAASSAPAPQASGDGAGPAATRTASGPVAIDAAGSDETRETERMLVGKWKPDVVEWKRAALIEGARESGVRLTPEQIEEALRSNRELEEGAQAFMAQVSAEVECTADHRLRLSLSKSGEGSRVLTGTWSCVQKSAWFALDESADSSTVGLDYRPPHILLRISSEGRSIPLAFKKQAD